MNSTPELATASGQVVDIFNARIFPGTIHISDGRISKIEPTASAVLSAVPGRGRNLLKITGRWLTDIWAPRSTSWMSSNRLKKLLIAPWSWIRNKAMLV